MSGSFDLIPLNNQISVSNYYANTVDLLNITGLYNTVKNHDQYEELKNDLAKFLSNSYEIKKNKDFHNSLNIFQKNGYFYESIYEEHIKKMGVSKGLIELITRETIDIAPIIYDSYLKKRENDKLTKFIIGWLGYINRSNNTLISFRVKELFARFNKKFNFEKFEYEFYKYADDFAVDLPVLSNLSVYEKNRIHDFIISISDLSNPDTSKRAKDFSNLFLNIHYDQADKRISDIHQNQEYLSDIVSFSGISIKDILGDLANNIEVSKQSAYYSIENDPFAIKREHNKEIISQSIKYGTPIGLASLTFFTGPIGDALLTLSAPAINKLLNPEIDINKTIEIRKRLEKERKE